jgi:hypothetical protein
VSGCEFRISSFEFRRWETSMTAKTTRILKDARPLLLPWCAVALAGAVPLVHPLAWTTLICLVGFFVVPLLATLSLGEEFQHRTLSLLLSQPVGRMEIWGEKLGVTVVAVVSAVLVFSLALRATAFHPGRLELAFAAAWIVAITASATFWTLFTRSTVGGIALNIGVQSFIMINVPWANLAEWLRARGYLSPLNTIVVPTVTVFCYAGVMLWLGGRTLARFQVTGGMAGDDLLMAGPDVMPGALAGWLRCRPAGGVLNLFRKELRLLRPVWLVSLLAALGWACLTLFGFLFERGFSRNFETAVVIMGVGSTLMITILAGSMPLGEERTAGTHSWHLTLPVSALLQWRIKLYMALFVGLVGAGLLPMLIAHRSLLASSHILVDVNLGMKWLLEVLLLTFASFWCACALNGTVRAVVWVTPAVIVLGLANRFGDWTGRGVMDLVVSRFNLFADFKFTDAVVSRFRTSQFLQFVVWGMWWHDYLTPVVVFILVPTLLLAMIQSYRLFRTQLQDSTLSLVRHLWPLALLVFLCSLPSSALDSLVFHASNLIWRAEFETLGAIEKIHPDTANLDASHPLQLRVEDLAKASPLSDITRRWLGNSRVTIAPHKIPSGLDWWGGRFRNPPAAPFQDYLVTIQFAGGSDCDQRFWHVPYLKRDMRMLVVICK